MTAPMHHRPDVRTTMKKTIRRLLPHAALVVVTALVVTAFTGRDEDDYFYKLNRGLELFGQVYGLPVVTLR